MTPRGTPNRSKSFEKTANTSLNTSTIFGEVNAGCIVAVVEGRGSARGEVGLATISLSNPTLILSQISDTRTYSRTLAKIAVLNPAVIIIPTNAGIDSAVVGSKLYQDIIAQFRHITPQQVHRKFFNESRGLQMVKYLCAPEYSSVELQIRHKYYALSAAHCLLKYVEFFETILFAPKSLKVEFQSCTSSMLIDVDTAKHIELLTSSLNMSTKLSLFGVLNKTCTSGGARLLRSTLFQPPIEEAIIEARLDAVFELVNRPEILTNIQAILARMSDLDTTLSLCTVLPKADTLHMVEQSLNQIITMKHTLELLPGLITVLSAEIQSPLLLNILEVVKSEVYVAMLEQIKCIISEDARINKGSAAMRLQRCFAIKEGICELMDLARQAYCELVKDVETAINNFSQAQGLPMRVGFNAQRGYHVQMSRSSVMAIKGKGFKLSQLPKEFLNPHQYKSIISFTTESVAKIDQQSQSAIREITLMSNVVVQELVSRLRCNVGSLYKLSEALSHLDLLASFADVSGTNNFTRPRFGPLMCVRGSKHPILDKMDVPIGIVSNDILATPLEANFQVITGPNMSGKSTYLKQILLLQIMAQSGCFVPADDVPMFRLADRIFSRVGMSDSIECNASTFAMEMKEMSYILNNLAESTALVVIDELGRGTSPEEGAALSWAISEALSQTSAFTFFATHFRLLTKMESISIGIVNSTFITELGENQQGLVHTHKIVRGQLEMASLSHYGIHLAQKMNFPQKVLDSALKIIEDMRSRETSAVPEIKDEDIVRLNYLRLALTLSKLSMKNDISMSDKVEMAKRFQEQFSEQAEEEGSNEMEYEDDV